MSQTNESCTRFAKLLGIEVPFLNAPMEGIATPELVAAVSEAGGLGVIPAAGLAPDEIRAFAARVKELTQKPFAVNLAVPVDAPADAAERFERFGDAVSMLLEELELPAGEGASYAERYDLEGCTRPDFFEQFDAALEVRPAAVISSFGGFREPEEEKLAELGIVNIGTATTLREAKVLRAAGCGAVIVQGAEAAGPRLSFEDPEDALVGLMSLVPAAVRATGLPVIAAGSFERIVTPSPAVFAYRRTLDEAVATILVNLSSQPASLGEVARGVSGELILSNRDLSEAEREAPGVLEPWEARVYLA